jgi:hypothetical protein
MTVEAARVRRTGPINGADGSVCSIRSTSDATKIPVVATVELSGPAMANGKELPKTKTAARMADVMNVDATP